MAKLINQSGVSRRSYRYVSSISNINTELKKAVLSNRGEISISVSRGEEKWLVALFEAAGYSDITYNYDKNMTNILVRWTIID